MRVSLAYGRGHPDIELPAERTTAIEPSHQAGLADERAPIVSAPGSPIGAAPLASQVAAERKIVIVHTDITRSKSPRP